MINVQEFPLRHEHDHAVQKRIIAEPTANKTGFVKHAIAKNDLGEHISIGIELDGLCFITKEKRFCHSCAKNVVEGTF